MSSTSNQRFDGQVVCITGASRGIGRAVAVAMAARGAKLLLLARSAQLAETAAVLPKSAEVLAVQGDVGQYGQVDAAISSAVARWGRIDTVINCGAVLGATGKFWETDPAQWADAIQVNLIGTYHTMRSAIPHMIKAGAGKIVNFAGGGAAYGYPNFSGYGSSKAAVVRLTETVAMETAAHNIQVNVIAPGAIETDMLREVRAAGGEVRSVGSMDQAIQLVVFLASPASNHLSGRFVHARDSYTEWPVDLPDGHYMLRRIPS